MGPYVHWQLHGPNCKGRLITTAALKLLGFAADVINHLHAELGGQTDHDPSERLLVSILGLRGINSNQLSFDVQVDGVTRLSFKECQQFFYVLLLFFLEGFFEELSSSTIES